MFSFASFLDLPLIWYGLIMTAMFLYVILDGFDLGVGILFPFAPSDKCRDRMMNSIAPFWDGNETWLILGGGGLFAAFPLAYAIVMPALYIPVILMLLGLVFFTTGGIWCLFLVVAAAWLSARFRRRESAGGILKKVTGALFIGLGIRLAFSQVR